MTNTIHINNPLVANPLRCVLSAAMSCLAQTLSVGPFCREEMLLYTTANLLTHTADAEEDYFYVDLRSPGRALIAMNRDACLMCLF